MFGSVPTAANPNHSPIYKNFYVVLNGIKTVTINEITLLLSAILMMITIIVTFLDFFSKM